MERWFENTKEALSVCALKDHYGRRCHNLQSYGSDLIGMTENKDMRDTRGKSWEQEPTTSLTIQCIYHIQHYVLYWIFLYSVQAGKGRLANLSRWSLQWSGLRRSSSGRGGNYGWKFLYTVESLIQKVVIDTFCTHWFWVKVKCSLTFKLGLEEGFAIPLSLTQAGLCIPMGLRHCGLRHWHGCTMSINTLMHNLLTPCKEESKRQSAVQRLLLLFK